MKLRKYTVWYSKQYAFIPLTLMLFLLICTIVPIAEGQEKKENFYSVLKSMKEKEIEAKKVKDAEKAKKSNRNNFV